MNVLWSWRSRQVLGVFAALAALLGVFLLSAAPTADAQTLSLNLPGGLVARVEEDWSVSVNQPDATLAAPQFSTQMARSPWASRFCNLHLNSVDFPSFNLGGVQTQSWHGSTNLAVVTSPDANIMSTPYELVTWTQYLRVDTASNQLMFGVGTLQPNTPGSSSTTWGDFSGMEVAVSGGSKLLDAYDPNYSVQNSGITFGSTRVDSMVLVAVRYYDAAGNLLSTDSTPRVVFSGDSGGDN
jgi:hypothetical protein